MEPAKDILRFGLNQPGAFAQAAKVLQLLVLFLNPLLPILLIDPISVAEIINQQRSDGRRCTQGPP